MKNSILPLAALALAFAVADASAQRVVRTRTVVRGGHRAAFVGNRAAVVAPGYSSAAFVSAPGVNVNVNRGGLFFRRRSVNVNVGGAAFVGQPAAFVAQPLYYQQQNFVAPVRAFRFNSYVVPQQNFVAPQQAFSYSSQGALTSGCQQSFTAPLVSQPQQYTYQQSYTYQQPTQLVPQQQLTPEVAPPAACGSCQAAPLQAQLAPQAYSGGCQSGAAFRSNTSVFRGRLVR